MTTGQQWVALTMLFTGTLAGISALRHHPRPPPPRCRLYDWADDPVLCARLARPTVRRIRTIP